MKKNKVMRRVMSFMFMLFVSLMTLTPALNTYATETTTPAPNTQAEKMIDQMKTEGGNTFKSVDDKATELIAEVYNLLLKVGIGLLAIVALIAAICFGMFKDSQAIKENKQWLVRIIIAIVIVGSVLTLVGIFSQINI